MKSGLYNLYDNGELVLEEVLVKEIKAFLGVKDLNVSQYASLSVAFRGRYTIEKIEERITLDEEFIKEWNKAVEPFKRVIWVKSGGRKLGG